MGVFFCEYCKKDTKFLPIRNTIQIAGVSRSTLAGGVIGHLVSVDQSGDYSFEVPIKDASAMNEMMEGIYPWTLEDGANTVVHLKSTTSQPVNGILLFDYYENGIVKTYSHPLIMLAPYQTVGIDIQKLKDSKTPDLGGLLLPASAMQGQAQWHQVEPYSMIGRAESTNVKAGTASSFSCNYGCCENYTETDYLSPDPLDGLAGNSGTLNSYSVGHLCNGAVWGPNTNSAQNWRSGTTSVATVTNALGNSGTVSYVAAGTALIAADAYETYYQYDFPCICTRHHNYQSYVSAQVTVQPGVSGPNTVWYFGGQNPFGYATSITLTSSGGSSTTWTVTAGSNKVNLSTTTGAQTTVTSSGTAFSSSVGDIGIQATAGGVASAVFSITSRKPFEMIQADSPTTSCDPSQYYISKIFYTIRDQLHDNLPANVPQNEAWTTGVTSDYSGANWPRGDASGSIVGPVDWFDQIGAYTGTGGVPTANCNGAGTAVQHWGQEWRFGNTTSGVGLSVQTDTIQKYINHAEHHNVISPD